MALTEALQGLGYAVYELPLLSLAPMVLDAQLKAQFAQFIQATIVVVVSPIAVELGMQYASQCGISLKILQNKQWIAVGASTQKALANYQIDSISPAVETSEGMLQLPILNDLISAQSNISSDTKNDTANVTIAFWRGIGGRTLMMDALTAQGCHVLNMLLYQRAMPDYSLEDLKQLAQRLPATILISSEQSWKNWQQLMRQLLAQQLLQQDQFSQNHYVVLGERVSQVLRDALQETQGVMTVQHLQANEIDSVVQNRNNAQ